MDRRRRRWTNLKFLRLLFPYLGKASEKLGVDFTIKVYACKCYLCISLLYSFCGTDLYIPPLWTCHIPTEPSLHGCEVHFVMCEYNPRMYFSHGCRHQKTWRYLSPLPNLHCMTCKFIECLGWFASEQFQALLVVWVTRNRKRSQSHYVLLLSRWCIHGNGIYVRCCTSSIGTYKKILGSKRFEFSTIAKCFTNLFH